MRTSGFGGTLFRLKGLQEYNILSSSIDKPFQTSPSLFRPLYFFLSY